MDFRKHPIFVVLEALFMKIIPDLQDTFALYTYWIFAVLVFLQLLYVILFFGKLASKKLPLSSQPPSVRTALVRSEAASEPAFGSVMANAPIFSPRSAGSR